ncbi:putative methyltransferase-domain-containing protein, partial [Pavlovales sp. CCMP2436]
MWQVLEHPVSLAGEVRATLRIRERRAPPPIGAAVWPASHVLLHWALDAWGAAGPSGGAMVLEIGSGAGLTAIGLALASQPGSVRSVLATDACPEALANCRRNIAENNAGHLVRTAEWDIAFEPPCDVQEITHVLAADVVYHGASGAQLVSRLKAMRDANPKLVIGLILVDRFSGGAVASLGAMNGVNAATVNLTARLDPAIEAFERAAADVGLELHWEPLGEGVARGLTESLPWVEQTRWHLLGTWPSMRFYTSGVHGHGGSHAQSEGPVGADSSL